MNYKDHWVTNEEGAKVLFTVEMQRRLDYAGLPIELASLSLLTGRQPQQERSYAPPQQQQPRTQSVQETTPEQTFEEPSSIQIDPQTGKYIGRMKWYNTKKGYGFIIRGAGEEIFFHKTGTVGEPTELKEGEWILYDVEETRKGPEATEIEPYEGNTEVLS
ncbi:MAG: cold shock domain-containing protein [Chloroflexi bacterium]|nr:cold shock domain-containing protein [Chloroflexota bacterium]